VYFLGGKGGRCVRLTTLPPSCAVIMKSGNLNFQEPSGLLPACNGTALHIYTYILRYISYIILRHSPFSPDQQRNIYIYKKMKRITDFLTGRSYSNTNMEFSKKINSNNLTTHSLADRTSFCYDDGTNIII
jgi:hypothetical protein